MTDESKEKDEGVAAAVMERFERLRCIGECDDLGLAAVEFGDQERIWLWSIDDSRVPHGVRKHCSTCATKAVDGHLLVHGAWDQDPMEQDR